MHKVVSINITNVLVYVAATALVDMEDFFVSTKYFASFWRICVCHMALTYKTRVCCTQ